MADQDHGGDLREWIAAAKLGDGPSRAKICQFVEARLYSKISGLAGKDVNPLDLLAETQLALLEGLGGLRGPASLLAYARCAAQNIVTRTRQKRRRIARVEQALMTSRKMSGPSVAHQNLESSELLDALKGGLTPREKTLFELEFEQALRLSEIARRLAITEHALACRRSRLRSKLGTLVERYRGNGTNGKCTGAPPKHPTRLADFARDL